MRYLEVGMRLLEGRVSVNARISIAAQQLSTVVTVNEALVKAQSPEFAALQQVFVLLPLLPLLPHGEQGAPVWTRYELVHRYRWETGGSGEPSAYDVYSAVIAASLADLDAMVWHGIAFGMDTNSGTLWLQTEDDNYRPVTI